MRKLTAALSVAACLVVIATATVQALTEEKVRATSAGEYRPAAGAGYLAWQQYSPTSKRYNAFVQPEGESKIRLNATGTQGATGGIDGTTLVYQQYNPKKNTSDIKLFDLVTRQKSEPPSGVNTKQWEYFPSVSGPWLLFGRQNVNDFTRKLILFNLDTAEKRTLATTGSKGYVGAGQVNGDYVVWDRCTPSDCNVHLYEISTDTTTDMPKLAKKLQYSPSVDGSGKIYFVRTSRFCGDAVSIVGRPLGGPSSVLAKLPAERDVSASFVFTDGEGSNHVFYDRFKFTEKCHWVPASADIYKIVDSPAVTRPISGPATTTSDHGDARIRSAGPRAMQPGASAGR